MINKRNFFKKLGLGGILGLFSFKSLGFNLFNYNNPKIKKFVLSIKNSGISKVEFLSKKTNGGITTLEIKHLKFYPNFDNKNEYIQFPEMIFIKDIKKYIINSQIFEGKDEMILYVSEIKTNE